VIEIFAGPRGTMQSAIAALHRVSRSMSLAPQLLARFARRAGIEGK
jgi:hypothetical protein